jgi:hypothetical protein
LLSLSNTSIFGVVIFGFLDVGSNIKDVAIGFYFLISFYLTLIINFHANLNMCTFGSNAQSIGISLFYNKL